MIYLFDTPERFTPLELEIALTRVSSQRREKALSYKFDIDRILCVEGYLLLKQGLSLEYGITEDPLFGYEANGKPFILAHPDIHFNLSHCKKGVICALNNHPVGVDIEQITPLDKDLAAFVLDEQELQEVLHSPYPDVSFARLWTRKESLLKLTGEGIRDDLKSLLRSVDLKKYRFTTMINKRQEYIYTLCEHA